MPNRPSPKIAGTIASLLHSRAPTPPLYAFFHNHPTPIYPPNYERAAILKELRYHGSDRVWPRSVKDGNFTTAIDRIATRASTCLRLPLPVIQDVLFSMMWPRMLPLLVAKEQNLKLISELECTGDFTEKEGEHGYNPKWRRLGNVPNQVYSVYKGQWIFRGFLVSPLSNSTGYETFKTVMRDVRPKGFADDPVEMWGPNFKVVWSIDGVRWSKVGDEEEFRGLYKVCYENRGKEFTVLFLENHYIPPEEQEWSL